MGCGKVVGRLHLDETARGSVELEFEFRARIQCCGLRSGRYDELHAAIVEFVDERDETACLVFVAAIEARNARYDDGRVPARDLDVIVLTSSTIAQVCKVEPRDAFGTAPHPDFTPVDFQHLVPFDMARCRFVEKPLQLLPCPVVVGREIGPGLFEHAQAVVEFAADPGDVQVGLQDLDGRQESLSLQTVPVKVVRMRIRCRYERNVALE